MVFDDLTIGPGAGTLIFFVVLKKYDMFLKRSSGSKEILHTLFFVRTHPGDGWVAQALSRAQWRGSENQGMFQCFWSLSAA